MKAGSLQQMMISVFCESPRDRHRQEKCASKCVRGNDLSAFVYFVTQRIVNLEPVIRKGSLTGKAVVLKTTAHVSLAGSTPVPSAKLRRRRLMVWQRSAKSPRIACAGSTPVASAKLHGPVAQWNESATLRRSRSHVRIVPGPPKTILRSGRAG